MQCNNANIFTWRTAGDHTTGKVCVELITYDSTVRFSHEVVDNHVVTVPLWGVGYKAVWSGGTLYHYFFFSEDGTNYTQVHSDGPIAWAQSDVSVIDRIGCQNFLDNGVDASLRVRNATNNIYLEHS